MRRNPSRKFDERLQDAASAKRAMLAKFKAAPAPDDPTVLARRREREMIVAARAVREADSTRQVQEH
jgi:hypothetical protein